MDLSNHFLIATPAMEDDLFGGSVIYMCDHTAHGALGLLINKPGHIKVHDLFDKVELPLARGDLKQQPVLQGGPVQTDRGFVLHEPIVVAGAASQEPVYASTLRIPGGLEMTSSKDVLEAMAHGGGPRKALLMLGYCAWEGGQLEDELTRNAWLTVHADVHVVFDTPLEQRYEKALSLLGLQAFQLMPDAGHA